MAGISNLISICFLPFCRRRNGKPIANRQRFVSKQPALQEFSRVTNQ
jgi:hypothetical protein